MWSQGRPGPQPLCLQVVFSIFSNGTTTKLYKSVLSFSNKVSRRTVIFNFHKSQIVEFAFHS